MTVTALITTARTISPKEGSGTVRMNASEKLLGTSKVAGEDMFRPTSNRQTGGERYGVDNDMGRHDGR